MAAASRISSAISLGVRLSATSASSGSESLISNMRCQGSRCGATALAFGGGTLSGQLGSWRDRGRVRIGAIWAPDVVNAGSPSLHRGPYHRRRARAIDDEAHDPVSGG